jgi:membrane-bound metal-dependent hydrolase YbcI (DUF457 family)
MALLARVAAERHVALRRTIGARPAFFYAAAVVTLWAADIDFLLREVVDSPLVRHGGATHSLVVGVLFGVLFTSACRLWYGAALPLLPVLGIGVGCAWAHPLMDMATHGGGAMVWWPFSAERHSAPFPVFYGARHSQPMAVDLHALTLVTELLFVAPLWWVSERLRRPVPTGPAPAATDERVA